jgi:hypothetical protein
VLPIAARGKTFHAKKVENLPPEENWALITTLHEFLLFIFSHQKQVLKIIKS